MQTMTAAEASRSFSAVLDRAEHGETIAITRAGRRIATVTPTTRATWGAFREALRARTPTDDPMTDYAAAGRISRADPLQS